MRVQLQTHSHVRLSRLIPAFPLAVAPVRGRALLRRRGFDRILVPGHEVLVDPFESVELHLDGGASQPSTCRLEIHDGPAARDLCFHQRLSQRVFVQPRHSWNADFIAGLMHTSPPRVRRMLFSEGAALTDVCRTQRLMRALFDVMSDDAAMRDPMCDPMRDLKRRVGWPPCSDLGTYFYDWFGISLDTARRLAPGGRDDGCHVGHAVTRRLSQVA